MVVAVLASHSEHLAAPLQEPRMRQAYGFKGRISTDFYFTLLLFSGVGSAHGVRDYRWHVTAALELLAVGKPFTIPLSKLFDGWLTQHSDGRDCPSVMLATELDSDPTLFVGIHELPPK